MQMSNPPSFAGKVALVTGAGCGIGRAVALAFAAEGAKVVVSDREQAHGDDTVHLIRQAGGNALFLAADVTDAQQVEALVAKTLQHFGALHCAVNNAGVEGVAQVPVADYPQATWDAVIAVNLSGVFLCMKHQLPPIVATQGAIVNMASVAGLSGGRVGAAYHASKHGVVGLTRAAAMEYADKGVRINAVAPGVIETAMAERLNFLGPAARKRVVGLHPLGRLGTPQDVAAAVLWLCSDGAAFITGHTLPVDGGFLI